MGSGTRKESELESQQFPAFRLTEQTERQQAYFCYSLRLLTSFLPSMASASGDAVDGSCVRDVCLHRSRLPSPSSLLVLMVPAPRGEGAGLDLPAETSVTIEHLMQGSKLHQERPP